jgi:predicted RNase H-like HicB family nuclease
VTKYDLYVESGPKHRKTMVHVPQLLGCIAMGATTGEALAATPGAITTYLAYLAGHGEKVDPTAPFATRVAQHITEGDWLGNGSPYLLFESDLERVSDEEIDRSLLWFHWMREDLAEWVDRQDEASLDAIPQPKGRPARAVLLHVLNVGGYLSAAVGGAPGFSAIGTAAERGKMSLGEALRQTDARAAELVRASTPEQRRQVIERPKNARTLRKALRRMLEHAWEHYLELADRAGGPKI